MKYFNLLYTPEQIKKRYHELALQHHPDKPTGNAEIMKEINNERDILLSGKGKPFQPVSNSGDFKYNKEQFDEAFQKMADFMNVDKATALKFATIVAGSLFFADLINRIRK